MEKAIVVDLDGTLCDIEHRVHHVQKDSKDWKSFNRGIPHDKLNLWCAKLIEAMRNNGYQTILLTGRSENTRHFTEEWLHRHKIEYTSLFMRANKDRRNDNEVKKDIYFKVIAPNYDVLFVVEDRLGVVKMWREIGVTCLQCDWGDF